MPLDLVALLPSAKAVIEGIISSSATTIGLDTIGKKLNQQQEPLFQFLKKLNDSLEQAADIAHLDLRTIIPSGKWRPDWLRAFFNAPVNRQPTRYLPHFAPVEALRKQIEHTLHYEQIEPISVERFSREFNIHVDQLAATEEFENVFDCFAKAYDDHRLQQHLLEMVQLEDYRLAVDMPPLKELYVPSDGYCLEWSQWEIANYEKLPDPQPLAQLVENYFEKQLYRKEGRTSVADFPCLILGADFGVGKSTFCRMTAARLAREFLDKRTGFIPVFTALRDHRERPNGIEDYLRDCGLLKNDGTKLWLFMDGLDESGPISDSNIRDFIEHFNTCCRQIHNESRVIVSSRLILGKKGEIARTIRERLGELFIRVAGFSPNKTETMVQKIGHIDEAFTPLRSMNYASLQEMGLSKEELQKPLFIWMLADLVRCGEIAHDKPVPLGKTGLYLLFLNRLRKDAKADAVDRDDDLEAKARHLLRHIAAIRNMMTDQQLMTVDYVRNCLDEPEQTIFDELQGEQFMTLTYMGRKGEAFEFTHQSFREFLVAEYLLSQLVQSTFRGGEVTDKFRLCIGELTSQTITFLEDLCTGLHDSFTKTELKDLLQPFVRGCCPKGVDRLSPLYRELRHCNFKLSQDQIKEIKECCLRWIQNDTEITFAGSSVEPTAYKLFGMSGAVHEPPSHWLSGLEICVSLLIYRYIDCGNDRWNTNKIINLSYTLLEKYEYIKTNFLFSFIFSDVIFSKTTIKDKDLSYDSNFFNVTFTYIYFDSTRIEHFLIEESDINNSSFENCVLYNIDFNETKFIENSFNQTWTDKVHFNSVIFDKTNFSLHNFYACIFNDCTFINVTFENSDFIQTHFEECTFHDTKFISCNTSEALKTKLKEQGVIVKERSNT